MFKTNPRAARRVATVAFSALLAGSALSACNFGSDDDCDTDALAASTVQVLAKPGGGSGGGSKGGGSKGGKGGKSGKKSGKKGTSGSSDCDDD